MLNTKILVLNYDYTVLGFTTFRRALPKILYDKVFIEEFSDNSVRDVIIPRVIRVKQYVQRKYKRQDFGTSLRRLIYKRDSYVCTYCRKPIYSKRELSLDHIVPKSKGGSDLYNNLVTSCVKCNNKKGDRTPEEAGMQLSNKNILKLPPDYAIMLSEIKENTHWQKYVYTN